MIGCVTQEAVDASNAAVTKAGYVTSGDPPSAGVPSAATGVCAHGDYSWPRPGGGIPVVSHPAAGLATGGGGLISAEDFRRQYITGGHAAESPANVPGRSQFTPAEALRQMWGAR